MAAGLEFVGAWEGWGLFLFDTEYRRLKGTTQRTVMVRERMAVPCPPPKGRWSKQVPVLREGNCKLNCVSRIPTLNPKELSPRAEAGL